MSSNTPDIVFEASAGTGKTFNVIQLYGSLVLGDPCRIPGISSPLCGDDNEPDGVPPDQILLMTFTENAAAELRLRAAQLLQAQLVDLLRRGDGDAAREQLIRTRLRQLSAAPICTIHAFCTRLLREHALSAGISPRFRILQGDELDALVDEVLYETIALAAASDRHLGAIYQAIGQARLTDRIRNCINALAECRWQPASGSVPAEWLSITRPTVGELIAHRADLLATGRRGAIKACLEGWDSEAPGAQEQEALVDLCWALRGAQKTASTVPAAAAVQEWATRFLAATHGKPYVEAFFRTVVAAYRAYRDAKARREALDFQDLIARAVDLLDRHPELTLPVDLNGATPPRYRVVIIDEVQDNSRLQYELVQRLWRKTVNRLVICGDPKQSIYIWRNADVRVLPDLERDITVHEPSLVVPLRVSYRSQPAVIEALNDICAFTYTLKRDDLVEGQADQPGLDYSREALLPRDEYETALCPNIELLIPDWQASGTSPAGSSPLNWEDLIPDQAWEAPDDLPFTRPHHAQKKTDRPPSAWHPELADPISAEAFAVARRIRLLVSGEDGWTPSKVYMGTAGWQPAVTVERPVDYRDILILFRHTTHQLVFEEALRFLDIPYTVSGKGKGFFQRPEVRDVHALLQVLVNPAHDVALLAVMRSPFIGISDPGLVALATAAEGRARMRTLAALLFDHSSTEGLQSGALSGEDRERLRRGRELFRRGRRLAGRQGVAAMLRSLIRASGFDAIQAGSPRGSARLANIKKLIDWVAAHEREGLNTLSSLVQMLQARIEETVDEPEAPIHDPAENAVQVMTIHASKGLTQKVVFIPDLRASIRLAPPEIFVGQTGLLEGRLPVPAPDGASLTIETDGYPDVGETARTDRWREMQNLFYVAVTRARDLVVFSGDQGRSKAQSVSNWRGWLNRYALARRATGCPPMLQVRSYGDLRAAVGSTANVPSSPPPSMRLLSTARGLCPNPAPRPAPVILSTTAFCHVMRDAPESGADMILSQAWDQDTISGFHGGRPSPDALPVDADAASVTFPTQRDPDGALAAAASHAAVGTTGHAVLEALDLHAPPGPQIEALCNTWELSIDQRQELSGQLCRAAADQATFWSTLAAARAVHREMPFAARFDHRGQTVELNGTIDLVYEDADGWHLVDYKFTRTATAARLRAAYALQLAIYRDALQRLGIHPVDTRLLVIAPTASSFVELDDALLKEALHSGGIAPEGLQFSPA